MNGLVASSMCLISDCTIRRAATRLVVILLLWVASAGVQGFAEVSEQPSPEQIADQAKLTWESGAIASALDLLDEGIQNHPDAVSLHQLRGDILSAFRSPEDAVQAYDRVLALQPAALDVRWAKWAVLVRWGRTEDALAELHRIAEADTANPLIHLRLAQELRKVDRLEESLISYEQAVALMPELLGWRLAMARARFDVLDYAGAEADLRYVLQHGASGSPLELPVKNQIAQLYDSMDRGRRFEPVLTPETSAAQLKEWADIRADAWKLYAAGRFSEAEPIYRKLLALNPRDVVATHQLGVTLMNLDRCEDALTVFGNLSNLDPSEEDYADTTFRMGQCFVELERWEEAFVHFQVLYDAAVEFEEVNRGVAFPAGMRVLAKEKIAKWLDKVRPHVPELAKLKDEEATANRTPGNSPAPSTEELYLKAVQRVKPQNVLDTGTTLMGRDADFSWFRYVIPAGKVVRDDYPTGAHEFISLQPTDTFASTKREIYLVFGLLSASYDAVSLAAQCYIETAEATGPPRMVAQDRVMTATNDQSGYFMLTPPEQGWVPGYYRCGLFEGERASAYTSVDEVRFRIVER